MIVPDPHVRFVGVDVSTPSDLRLNWFPDLGRFLPHMGVIPKVVPKIREPGNQGEPNMGLTCGLTGSQDPGTTGNH